MKVVHMRQQSTLLVNSRTYNGPVARNEASPLGGHDAWMA